MTTVSNDKKMLVDYGVQIRFIKDLDDTGGGFSDRYKTNGPSPASNKYGVAVRVQGISGHPYVVLKDGEKGDSYGVQLNTPTSSSSSGSPSPFNSLTKPTKVPAEFTNPYSSAANTARSPVSPVSPAEEEIGEIFGSPLKRPPGDGQAGTQGEEEARAGRQAKVEKEKVVPQLKPTSVKVENGKDWTKNDEFNEAGLRRVKLNSVGPKGFKPSTSGVNTSLGRYGGTKSFLKSFSEAADKEQTPTVDTKSLSPINKLITKFDAGTTSAAPQTRGRSGARQRLRFDERKRSRSLDARSEPQPEVPLPPPPAVNPYAPLSTSSTSLSSSLGKISAFAPKVSAPQAPKTNFTSQETFVTKNFSLPVTKKPVSTTAEPSLRSKTTDVIAGEEPQVRNPVLNISTDR